MRQLNWPPPVREAARVRPGRPASPARRGGSAGLLHHAQLRPVDLGVRAGDRVDGRSGRPASATSAVGLMSGCPPAAPVTAASARFLGPGPSSGRPARRLPRPRGCARRARRRLLVHPRRGGLPLSPGLRSPCRPPAATGRRGSADTWAAARFLPPRACRLSPPPRRCRSSAAPSRCRPASRGRRAADRPAAALRPRAGLPVTPAARPRRCRAFCPGPSLLPPRPVRVGRAGCADSAPPPSGRSAACAGLRRLSPVTCLRPLAARLSH